MAELKTKESKASVGEFLASIEEKQKRADCKAIATMMREATGKRAKMWGKTIVGFDKYNYKYESGHSGSAAITGFSPRAQSISVYIMPGFTEFAPLMKKLGKYKTGKSCLYIKRLEDVDQKVLSRLIKASVKEMHRRYNKN
jgi:hypothetical protein